MNRRTFLQTALFGASAAALHAALPKMKITRIRFYHSPISRPMFNQSFDIVTIETDAGITGIGEGGSHDTVQECAEMLIGEDPTRIEHCWQLMLRGRFYPAGREKLDAMGALDMALWDIKGKALGVPIHQLLGGPTRNYIDCYSTSFPNQGSLAETARACIEFGFRAFRTSVADPERGQPFDVRQIVRKTADNCRVIHDAVTPNGDWAIDYHTRLDPQDAVHLSTLIEPLDPLFCEDLVRSEYPGIYKMIRQQVKVPIAVGEQFGYRWDINELIENNWINYARVTIPNVGGITEYKKIADLCETHYIGLIPHFTGPVAETALTHVCGAFSGPVVMEMTGKGPGEIPYLPERYDFNKGKIALNDRPGLGVTLDTKPLTLAGEFATRNQPIPLFHRPDGSFTNW